MPELMKWRVQLDSCATGQALIALAALKITWNRHMKDQQLIVTIYTAYASHATQSQWKRIVYRSPSLHHYLFFSSKSVPVINVDAHTIHRMQIEAIHTIYLWVVLIGRLSLITANATHKFHCSVFIASPFNRNRVSMCHCPCCAWARYALYLGLNERKRNRNRCELKPSCPWAGCVSVHLIVLFKLKKKNLFVKSSHIRTDAATALKLVAVCSI